AEDGIRDRNVTGVQTCALPILRIRMHGVGSMTLPKRLMINVFDRPMNSANLPWHFSYGILLSTFYFWRRPHINNRGNTVVDHLLPTMSINPFESAHPPQVLSDLPCIASPGPICWMKILHC